LNLLDRKKWERREEMWKKEEMEEEDEILLGADVTFWRVQALHPLRLPGLAAVAV
jgi:hypothetical protein